MDANTENKNCEQVIPKVIHYCWFGNNPLPPLAKECIKSWEKYCPDYEIRRWDESNFDLSINAYVQEAAEADKWAFVSDIVRLYALVEYGGIYMDTDVEVVKNLDPLLQYEAVSGFESETHIPTGLMASKAGHPLIKEFLEQYDNLHFVLENGEYDFTTNCTRITDTCINLGLKLNNSLQCVEGFTILPKDYLCPKDVWSGDIPLTENTLAIHHFNGSWLSPNDRDSTRIRQKLSRFMPLPLARVFARSLAELKNGGVKGAVAYLQQKKQ